MLRFSPLALILPLLLLALPASAQEQDTAATLQPPAQQAPAPEAAKQAADEWLALVDAGDYEQSWEEASSLLKEQVSKEQWVTAVAQVPKQLGALQSRSLDTAQYTTKLPKAPEGEYVVAQYRAAFEQVNAMEIVILAKEEGVWKVAGYVPRPTAAMQGQGQDNGS